MSNYDNTNSGVLFKNDKKGNEKAPDYKGKVNIEGKEKDIAGWIREGKSGKFISIKISEPMKKDTVFDNKPKSVFDKPSTDLPF
jgi:uncharacterized protein (DUF736 family)